MNGAGQAWILRQSCFKDSILGSEVYNTLCAFEGGDGGLLQWLTLAICILFHPSYLELQHASQSPSQRCVKRFLLLLLALCLSSQLHSWRSLVGLLLLRCQITQDLGRLSLLLSWEPCLFRVSSNHLKNAELQKRPEMPLLANICACLLQSQWSAETTPAHLTDRQQREPEGPGQISLIYATKPFNVLR